MKKPELAPKEKEKLLAFFGKLDTEMLKSIATAISMMVRAFEGKPIEPDDIITKLTNVKNILERSRFPTYPLLAKQVYLRLAAILYPEAVLCEKWADLEAEALISYKGLSREEYVDISKAASQSPEQQFHIGQRQLQPEQPRQSRWARFRKPKQKENEFVAA